MIDDIPIAVDVSVTIVDVDIPVYVRVDISAVYAHPACLHRSDGDWLGRSGHGRGFRSAEKEYRDDGQRGQFETKVLAAR